MARIKQARPYCELADMDAGECDESRSGRGTRGLLIRRNIADGDLTFFTNWAPDFGSPLDKRGIGAVVHHIPLGLGMQVLSTRWRRIDS